MIIAVVGLGLIGGSLCKAVKAYTDHFTLGLDTDEETVRRALADGAIDSIIGVNGLIDADLTIVSLYPEQTVGFILQNAAHFRPGSLVIDVCGVKAPVVAAVSPALRERGVHFIGAHPMAGREFSGYGFSQAELFQSASFIMTPALDADPASVSQLESFALSLGFGRVIKTDPAIHDANIAFTSQLAHIVSNAYVKSPTLASGFGFTAGSFLDLTRVAKLNEDMWSSLFMLNREALMYELQTIIAHLNEYLDALRHGKSESLRSLLKDGRVLKESSLNI
ncbi:MAG: prephenate dehydrogenase [Clostridiales bacterium]|nr:prephenate dehydrogenase [Clostridiales bacterium]